MEDNIDSLDALLACEQLRLRAAATSKHLEEIHAAFGEISTKQEISKFIGVPTAVRHWAAKQRKHFEEKDPESFRYWTKIIEHPSNEKGA